MFWIKKKKAEIPPQNSTPAEDIAVLGPVLRHNHIGYVPSPDFALVPGVGTGNLAYAPDLLLSAPAFYGGNAILCEPNVIISCQKPAFINAPKQVIEGIGGIVAGQIVHQPLLEINSQNDNTGTV